MLNTLSYNNNVAFNTPCRPGVGVNNRSGAVDLVRALENVIAVHGQGLLQGKNIEDIAERVNRYLPLARTNKDLELIILMVLKDADKILKRAGERYGCDLTFADLFSLSKLNPGKKISDLVFHMITEKNPDLAAAAAVSAEGQILDNPHIKYVSCWQNRIELTQLKPGDIYERRNAEDAEFSKIEQDNIEKNTRERRENNQRSLANLEVTRSNSLKNSDDYRRARLQEAMGVAI
jgi:hypothetical protein